MLFRSAKKLIPVLNVLTLHFTKSATGKKGGGSFDQFNEGGILAVLKDFAANGAYIPGKGAWKGLEAPVVLEACEEFSGVSGAGAVAATAKKMADNAAQLTLSVPSGFPQREDMPVISKGKGHLELAVKLLNSGAVDVNPPHAKKSKFPGGVTGSTKP